jgi:primosomal replication protein N
MPQGQDGAQDNRLVLTAQIVEMSALRHTPVGIPVIGLKLRHVSRQVENSLPREVSCEIEAVALGPQAERVRAGAGLTLRLEGFLAQKSQRNTRPVLHIQRIEFIEGN